MVRQVLQTVMPWLSLGETFAEWEQISADLAERPRKRKFQEELLLDLEDDFM
jgi:hypothetical protein